jgi:hypothetical protein
VGDVRRILYSPGYGAGWTSWHGGPTVQRKFMLEYKPIVDAVMHPGVGEAGPEMAAKIVAALVDMHATHEGWTREEAESTLGRFHRVGEWPVRLAAAVLEFIKDWGDRFPGVDTPYLGGLKDVEVYEVEHGAEVKITEYDGSESVRVRGDDSDEYL